MAKTGKDQDLKLSPQSHILFLKAFFDKKHGKHPLSRANIHGRNSLSPARHSFFSDPLPLFKIWEWKLSPQQKGGGSWYCDDSQNALRAYKGIVGRGFLAPVLWRPTLYSLPPPPFFQILNNLLVSKMYFT